MAVDISTELEKIENNPNGSVVKDAIYSALLKLALSEGGGGTGSVVGPAWHLLEGFKSRRIGYISTEEE